MQDDCRHPGCGAWSSRSPRSYAFPRGHLGVSWHVPLSPFVHIILIMSAIELLTSSLVVTGCNVNQARHATPPG